MPIKTGAPASLRALQYRRRYCVQLEEFMGRGYSFTAFAGEIGTSRANLLRWCEEHSPFAKAFERGQARRVRLLEERLLAADGTKAFGLHMRSLKTAAPDEWPKAPRTKPQAKLALHDGPEVETGLDLPDNGRDLKDA